MNQTTVTGFRLKLYPKDFAKARAFYEQTLGFVVINEWDRGEHDRGVMLQVGPAIIELLTPETNYTPVAGADLSLEVPDVRALWQDLKDRTDVVFVLRDNDWGDSSFCVNDPERFEITFFTPQEQQK
ncbi:MAG: VOC family protein [Candidatus Saccharibacteria bacterium]